MCTRLFWIFVPLVVAKLLLTYQGCSAQPHISSLVQGAWQMSPASAWSLHNKIPMFNPSTESETEFDDEMGRGKGPFSGGKLKVKKKYKKFMLPLLIAYKLKFFALIPIMIGGLLLLTGATGLAGFFFALFAASMGLNKGH